VVSTRERYVIRNIAAEPALDQLTLRCNWQAAQVEHSPGRFAFERRRSPVSPVQIGGPQSLAGKQVGRLPLVPDIHARRRLIVPGAARGSSLAARVSSPSRPSAFCSGSIPWTYWCHSRTAPRPPRPRRAHRLRLRPGRPPVTRSRSSSSVILGDTEDTWKTLFGQMGGEYHPPRLVLFRGAVDSACGLASSAVGLLFGR
jgi:hypothetical protein